MDKNWESCHICKSDNQSLFLHVKEYDITRCHSCSHIQVNPIPDEKKLMEMYQHVDSDSFYANGCSVSLQEKEKQTPGFLKAYFSERIEAIQKTGQGMDRYILDFGCTNGAFVKAMIDAGYKNSYGYDITEDLVLEGQKQGLNLSTGDLRTFAETTTTKFDIIITYNVFEHLPYPHETVAVLKKFLKKDGYLIINIPHINSLQGKLFKEKSPIIDPPFHIHYFSTKSMKQLLEKNGFEVTRQTTPFWGKEADTYLLTKGYSKLFAVSLRYLMSPVRFIIQQFNLGGVMLTSARLRKN